MYKSDLYTYPDPTYKAVLVPGSCRANGNKR